ncbi:MAG: hypothetical protein EOP50_21360 [Sphingobacteriales bacterium]|nr:MAG: hypothetical protein EOP50_21360 [Sphingobacteriales bacterium]
MNWARAYLIVLLLGAHPADAQSCVTMPRTALDIVAFRILDSLQHEGIDNVFYYAVRTVTKWGYSEVLLRSGKRLTKMTLTETIDGTISRTRQHIRRSAAMDYFYKARVDTVTTEPKTEVVVTHSPVHVVYARRAGKEYCFGIHDFELADSSHPRAHMVLLLRKSKHRSG